jgi:hypothetical protein
MIINDCVNVVKLLSVGELLSKRCVTIYFGYNYVTPLIEVDTEVSKWF